MSSRTEREGLLARVRQIRRLPAMSGVAPTPRADEPEPDVLQSLQARVTHLEHQLQGLQDSVHRESSRQSKQIADLEAQIQPAALSRALSQDARERGI